MIVNLVFLLCFTSFLFHSFATSSSLTASCNGGERSALLQFKYSFAIDCQDDPLAYPKLESWKLNYDCCSWDGVTCDDQTGHVVRLDLSNSCLYGSINSTSISSLFHLVHLRSLNLACNNFNLSQIPSNLTNLSELTSLNLSFSHFHGQIPPNISQLSKLTALDLSENDELVLENFLFDRLVENLTNLEDFRLGFVNISSKLPLTFANLSSLKSLFLSYCQLYGEFPIGIFQLPYLHTLKIYGNSNLNGYFPEFNFSSPLQDLILGETNFSGKIPDSIGNLASLNVLDIRFCGFSGQVPVSLGNNVKLEILSLYHNNFEINNSSSLSCLGKLNRLRWLGLSRISFNKTFPIFFSNLTQLTVLTLENCEMNGRIPPWLMNFTQLVFLSLPNNQLQGPIPDSILQLRNLEFLNLNGNDLSGTVKLDMFLNKLKKLTSLHLSGNNLSLLDSHVSNSTFRKFSRLGFAECGLKFFPNVLRDQDELKFLDLSKNVIHGQIPKWIWNASRDTLENIDLSDNFLIGFEQDPIMLQWSQVKSVDLSGNMLQGSLPMPPSSIIQYKVDNNNLKGHISPSICNLNALRVLDLSYNNFTGTIPPCFDNLSSFLQVLNLGGNKFHGKIPHSHTDRCNLRVLILDSNELEGEVPRSLSNCEKLEFVILGNNKINDVFPFWLGLLQELKVLILRSNKFHGGLENHHNSNSDFPKLHIIDISHNNLSGKLPVQYFLNWNAMKMITTDELVYMQAIVIFEYVERLSSLRVYYLYSMTITNKGTTRKYPKILESLVAIDFSSNNFEGGIPQIIGNLNGLRLLNLSNNKLTGGIPTSLANLTKLESLDLSRNNLVGKIPQQLTQLGFLSVFNVSFNHLTGSIPHGKQFDTFDNSSYQNNSGLCGNPLSRKCGNLEALPPSSSTEGIEDIDSFFDFGWKPVLMGYVCGLIVGAVIGHIAVTRNFEWFLKTFRIRLGRMTRGTMSRT